VKGNPLLTEIAAGARLLGWERPGGIDHVEYARRAVAVMWALAFELRRTGPSWLKHVYWEEADDLSPRLPFGRYQAVLDEALRRAPTLAANPLAYDLAIAAPSRWAAEASLLAEDRRRTGCAQSLVRSCARIQAACVRHGVEPVALAGARQGEEETDGTGRAYATRLRDDGRGRGLYLLARETEILREGEALDLWGPIVSPARPLGRRAGEGSSEFDEFGDEGWSS
jgi:hypothetical protein